VGGKKKKNLTKRNQEICTGKVMDPVLEATWDGGKSRKVGERENNIGIQKKVLNGKPRIELRKI